MIYFHKIEIHVVKTKHSIYIARAFDIVSHYTKVFALPFDNDAKTETKTRLPSAVSPIPRTYEQRDSNYIPK